ncbi:glutathione S-transferase family protein [Parvularcula maris]|uniref:Glutathione S-transferase N-terminal domain-containing protein n=1 Tax=Parvularcula maris TaxID=2965077 RepID=A0A9X2L9V4_9PROT|nr:glutathione S-transferase N-terminal domain-containing protein [Parvularcula maris]MCQ8185766.1 glutathione S-transferase N-terminal domain-containing protein [Parvularcula maris]
MTIGQLYGSAFSPYVRLCRLVAAKAGAEVGFRLADPFDPEYRAVNPLGKVPALKMAGDGPLLLDTGLICRTLIGEGRDLLPSARAERLQHEADIAVLTGVLDLGVALLMEKRREADISAKWQQRRIDGIERAYPLIEAAAPRAASSAPDGYLALMMVSALQWLDFRLSEELDWRAACPGAAKLVDSLAEDPDVSATDPSRA